MTLDELLTEWEKDSVIDSLELGSAATETAKIQAKYIREYALASLKSNKIKKEYTKKRWWKEQYLNGDFNDPESLKKYDIKPMKKLILKQDIPKYLDSDDELNGLLLKKDYYDQIVQACKFILKQLENRTYAIGNAIKHEMFKAGAT